MTRPDDIVKATTVSALKELPERSDHKSVRQSMHDERARLTALIGSLTASFDDLAEAADASPPDDEHDPEGHTIAYERSQLAARRDQYLAALRELDTAEQRLNDGVAETCARCSGPIPQERRQAVPGTTVCISCAGPKPHSGLARRRRN